MSQHLDSIPIGRADDGRVTLDPKALVTTKMLVTANSGGGKSYLLRKVLEQVGQTAQTFVLDLEGEFVTLRGKLDLVIVGPGGEIPTDVRSAGLLVRRLMEKNISAVIDMSELRAQPRRQFVREFCETLVGLPKSLWRPLFVCIDEAHQFAPEKGQGEAESLSAVRDLCTLGRKRGYCPILATQRISTLDKSCAGECNNKFIGRMTLDVDIKRAAFELGVSAAEALKMLRDLPPGEFYGFGPAIEPNSVTRVKVDRVDTTHPKAGQGNTLTPPKPSKAITSVVGELADLPKQAEAEIKDMAAAKVKIAELQRQVATKPAPAPAATRDIEKPVITDAQLARLEKLHQKADERVTTVWDKLQGLVNPLMDLLKSEQTDTRLLLAAAHAVRTPAPAATVPRPAAAPARVATARPSAALPVTTGDLSLSAAQRRILSAAAWWASIGVTSPSRAQVAFVARIKPTGGHFSNSIGPLLTNGLLANGGNGGVELTAAGQAAAPQFTGSPSLASYHAGVREVLATGAQQKIFDAIVEQGGTAISTADLGAAVGIDPGGGHFSNSIGPLSTLGLIDRRGGVVTPTKLMFPDGLQ